VEPDPDPKLFSHPDLDPWLEFLDTDAELDVNIKKTFKIE
jgi:hypothetical protein